MKFIFITWNIAGLPSIFNFSGTTVNKAEMIYNKLEPFLLLKDCVVINLQEMFDKGLLNNFIDILKSKKINYVYNPRKKNRFFGINSGLITISNCKINEHKFQSYVNSHGEDSFSNKGILSCKINGLLFLNTHMQNENVIIGFREAAAVAHRKQVMELNNYYNNLKSNCLGSGDFNTTLQLLTKFIPFVNSWEPKESTINNTTPDFFFSNFSPKIINIETKKYSELSDHRMVVMFGKI